MINSWLDLRRNRARAYALGLIIGKIDELLAYCPEGSEDYVYLEKMKEKMKAKLDLCRTFVSAS